MNVANEAGKWIVTGSLRSVRADNRAGGAPHLRGACRTCRRFRDCRRLLQHEPGDHLDVAGDQVAGQPDLGGEIGHRGDLVVDDGACRIWATAGCSLRRL